MLSSEAMSYKSGKLLAKSRIIHDLDLRLVHDIGDCIFFLLAGHNKYLRLIISVALDALEKIFGEGPRKIFAAICVAERNCRNEITIPCSTIAVSLME